MILRNPKAPVVVGTLVIFVLIGYLALYRSSPGDLSGPHQQAAGLPLITNCKKCHDPRGMAKGCLTCHTEIGEQLQMKRGFHPIFMGKEMKCTPCHSEHHGKDFNLINSVSWKGVDLKRFTHPHVKFNLKGKHDRISCDACHKGKLTRSFSLPDFPDLKRKNTFLGLTQKCVSCHDDIHARGLSPECTKCHGQERWKPAAFFNHNKFFPLVKGHAFADCKKCHSIPKSGPRASEWFPFDQRISKRCQDCHRNPHRVNWKRSCESCHGTDASPWINAHGRITPQIHALTGFHLRPPHDKAKCAQCHRPGLPFGQKFQDSRAQGYRRSEKNCEACHKDQHRGQFAEEHPQCSDCHQSRGFKPVKFGIREHESVYPLKGGHAAVPCIFCHKPDASLGTRRFKGTSRSCATCHRDQHAGQFQINGVTSCENCHRSTVSFKTLIFDHNRQSRFKLDEAHINVACSRCHPNTKTNLGRIIVRFKPLRSECKDCHALQTR